jgi:hypothetical protein
MRVCSRKCRSFVWGGGGIDWALRPSIHGHDPSDGDRGMPCSPIAVTGGTTARPRSRPPQVWQGRHSNSAERGSANAWRAAARVGRGTGNDCAPHATARHDLMPWMTSTVPDPTPLFDASGRLPGAVNMLADSSERKAAALALAERNIELALTAKAGRWQRRVRRDTCGSGPDEECTVEKTRRWQSEQCGGRPPAHDKTVDSAGARGPSRSPTKEESNERGRTTASNIARCV